MHATSCLVVAFVSEVHLRQCGYWRRVLKPFLTHEFKVFICFSPKSVQAAVREIVKEYFRELEFSIKIVFCDLPESLGDGENVLRSMNAGLKSVHVDGNNYTVVFSHEPDVVKSSWLFLASGGKYSILIKQPKILENGDVVFSTVKLPDGKHKHDLFHGTYEIQEPKRNCAHSKT